MTKTVAIIGGGPAGLMAAQVLSAQGMSVTLFEAMPTVGRKFLLAGKSGLNVTHAEPHEKLRTRFGAANGFLRPALDQFTAQDVCIWAQDLGVETFTGTSGRIFPRVMKASPLLRALLMRLTQQGVEVRVRHRFIGFSQNGVIIETPGGNMSFSFDAVLLAFGGASWPKLGSNGNWVAALAECGVDIAPFKPSNCGFDVNWSEGFAAKHAGAPVKSVAVSCGAQKIQGEFVVSRYGVEGSLIYAHGAALREQIDENGMATLLLDLSPGKDMQSLCHALVRQKPKDSFSTRLRKGAGLDGVKAALLRECVHEPNRLAPHELSALIKALPLVVQRPRPIDEAISSAGGIRLHGLTPAYMLKQQTGVFVAGEMLDWEAPTGGYLMTACLATGRAAARGIIDYLQ